MQDQLRRNDLCPCNSRRKCKDCHMRSAFNPRERFQVPVKSGNVAPTYHLERRAGTNEWEPVPGL